jgi:hypothetical protein
MPPPIYGTNKADNVTLYDTDDIYYARNGTDTLRGGNGDDQLYGQNGDDTLYGGNDNDLLSGGNGDDWLYGEADKDVFTADHGNDHMTGGSGADVFHTGKAAGNDIVYDFSGPDETVLISDTINFDAVPGASRVSGENPIPVGYEGFNWDNFYTLHQSYRPGSGYDTGVVSGEWVAYNASGEMAALSDEDFNLESGYFTSAWYNDNEITIRGYQDGVEVATQVFTVGTTGPTLINFKDGFDGIDRATFSSSNEHFALDDLTISREEVIPGDGDKIALDGGTADDITAVLNSLTTNADGDAVVNYRGATMTLENIAATDVTADYFMLA